MRNSVEKTKAILTRNSKADLLVFVFTIIISIVYIL